MIVKSVSSDRLIIEVNINNKKGYMLVDTGASIGLIDIDSIDEYHFDLGKQLNTVISGVGGESQSEVYYTKNLNVDIQGISVHQLVATDISSVKHSIKQNTGITICGILGLTQIKLTEMKIAADCNTIKLGY